MALTYRRMPQHTGGKGSYGHRHRTQEEIYFVVSGTLQFKLDDEVIAAGPGTAVRVAPEVVRSVWNDEPEDAHLVIVSARLDEPQQDAGLRRGLLARTSRSYGPRRRRGSGRPRSVSIRESNMIFRNGSISPPPGRES